MDIPHTASKLPAIAQCNVYRYVDGRYEFLLLKRIDERKHFWQPVTEPVKGTEQIGDALKRGLQQQAGVVHIKKLSEETYSYEWYTSGQRGRNLVFAVEVHPASPISIDNKRYLEYSWLSSEDAINTVKWSGNKEALRRLQKRLASEPRSPEIELNTHDAPANVNLQAPVSQPGRFVSQVRHDQLPELPENKNNTDYGLL